MWCVRYQIGNTVGIAVVNNQESASCRALNLIAEGAEVLSVTQEEDAGDDLHHNIGIAAGGVGSFSTNRI